MLYQTEDTPISVTPEVSPIEKKKPKRSAKPKREQTEIQPAATIATHPAPDAANPAPIVNGTPPAAPYEWDRTFEEKRIKEAARVEAERLSRLPLPNPKAKTLPWSDFCEYWNSLRDLPIAPCVRLYVQRWLPVLLPVINVDRFNNAKESHPSDLKIQTSDGPLSEDLILQLGGVGDYTFRLNDTRRPWDQATVCQSQLETKRLWDLYPPVFDLDRLDLLDKKNQVYIKMGRARGILPRENDMERETTDMANAALTDRAFDEASKERARADQIQKDQLEQARAELANAKSATARAEAEAAEAKRQAEESKSRVNPGTPADELLSVVSSVATLAKSLKPEADNSLKEFLALEGQREQTRRERDKEERAADREAAKAERERGDRLQAEILAIRSTPIPTVAAAPLKTDADILEEMVKKQSLLKQLTGRGGSAAEEDAAKPSSVDKWLEAAPLVAPILGNFVQGLFQTILVGFQTVQLNHYNDAVSRSGGTPTPPKTMTQNVEPGKPAPPQAPAETPAQTAAKQQWDDIMRNAFLLAPHILSSLESDPPETGLDFAAFIIKRGPEKRVSYDRLRNLADDLTRMGMQVEGTDGLERFINAARFVFGKLPAPFNRLLGIQSVPKFLSEFYDYDEILARAEE